MQTAEKMNALNEKHATLKNAINNKIPDLKKVPHRDSNYTLMKRFLKELQLNNDSFLRKYNREVI